MKKILFATDFSENCAKAQEYVAQLAADALAQVDIIHIYKIPVFELAAIPSTRVATVLEASKAKAQIKLNHHMDELEEKIKGEGHLVLGTSPAEEIISVANKIKADCIITALDEEHGFLEKLLGSTTYQTLSSTNVPIIALPKNIKYLGLGEIVFPTEKKTFSSIPENEHQMFGWLADLTTSKDNIHISSIHVESETTDSNVDVVYHHDNIDYQKVFADNIVQGIRQTIKDKKANALALKLSDRNILTRILRPLKSKRLIYNSNVPLILFP